MTDVDDSSAVAGGQMKVFVRVATLAAPIPVICSSTATVAVLKERFLEEYLKTREENSSSPTDTAPPTAGGRPGGYTCRLVCRGRELVDTQCISVAVRPGDHIHAIVRAAEGAPVSAGRPVVQAIRADARRWVTELRRFLEDQQQQQQPTGAGGGGGGGVSTGPGTRTPGDGRASDAPSRSGSAATGSAREQHQRVLQLQGGDATAPTRRGSNDETNESTTEFGGADGQFPILVERDDVGATADLANPSQGSIVGGYRSLTEKPFLTWAGVLCGFFFGFVVIFFIFAAKELRLEFRVGVAAGLVTNVLFAWLLPSPTQVPLR